MAPFKAYHTQKYRRVILSERFRALKERLEARHGCCQRCGARPKPWKTTLRLHHKHYRTLGKETSRDVVLVCGPCHKKIHRRKRR